ncbi:MAG: GPR endopeptidase [Clostridia bacterium]
MMREFENIFIENAVLVPNDDDAIRERVKFYSIGGERTQSKDGEYYSLELPKGLFMDEEFQREVGLAAAKCLKTLFKKYRIRKNQQILAVGVGNEGMTADALGAKALKYLDITEHFYRDGINMTGKGRLAAIAGSVSGVTGLLSYDIVKGVTERVKPNLIIAIDTLASKRTSRLQRVIQISDKGITPGSGVNNAKTMLSAESLGVPVIAIGVPLVIYARNIVADYMGEAKLSSLTENARTGIRRASDELDGLVVTVKEIDVTVEDFAKVIGFAINTAVHG